MLFLFESTLHQFQYFQKSMPMYSGMLYQSVYQFINLSVGLTIVNFDNDWALQIHICVYIIYVVMVKRGHGRH